MVHYGLFCTSRVCFYSISWITAHVYRIAMLLRTMPKITGQYLLEAFTLITSMLWKTHSVWAMALTKGTEACFIDMVSQRLITDYIRDLIFFLPLCLKNALKSLNFWGQGVENKARWSQVASLLKCLFWMYCMLHKILSPTIFLIE